MKIENMINCILITQSSHDDECFYRFLEDSYAGLICSTFPRLLIDNEAQLHHKFPQVTSSTNKFTCICQARQIRNEF